MPRYSLYLFKTPSQGVDITEFTEAPKWKGRKSTPVRTLTAKLIDDDAVGRVRTGIDVEKGHQVIFKADGEEVFRGIIMNTAQTEKKMLTFTAYDNAIYLTNNKDTFSYTDKTADEIFIDVCKRFNIPTDRVDKCSYRIPELNKSNTTAWDAIADALSLDFDNTRTRHCVISKKGKLSLIERKKNILQWVLEAGENVFEYSLNKSIEKIKTRVKLLSKENTVITEERDTELEKKIGIFQDIDKPDETLNEAQIKQLAKTQLKEKSTPEKTLTITALGKPDIISGVGVYVKIPHIDTAQTYYVDEDTHSFDGEVYKLSLKLNHVDDM